MTASPLPGTRLESPRTFAARRKQLDAQHRKAGGKRYPSLLLHWLARWFRAPAAATLEALPPAGLGQVAVTFGGQGSLLLRYARTSVCVDPMLGRWIGPIRREVECGLALGDLDDVALILITQLTSTRLHLPSLAKLPKGAMIIGPKGLAHAVRRLGFARVVELAPGTSLEQHGLTIHAESVKFSTTPALAYVLVGDGPSLFLCGQTAYYSGFADIGARFAPDIACLPIGGYRPHGFRARNLSPLDAVYAFEDLRARLLVPTHHSGFAMSYEHMQEPVRWLSELMQGKGLTRNLLVLRPGQTERVVSPEAASVPLPVIEDVDTARHRRAPTAWREVAAEAPSRLTPFDLALPLPGDGPRRAMGSQARVEAELVGREPESSVAVRNEAGNRGDQGATREIDVGELPTAFRLPGM